MTGKLMLRHDCPLNVVIATADGRVLKESVVEARLLDTHLMVQAFCHGGVSGMTRWHDGQGNPLSRAPQASYTVADESFILKDGELCECDECLSGSNG